MLFHNLHFLLIFLPVVFFIYFFLKDIKLRFLTLVIFGFIFYAAWNVKLSPLILGTIFINYFLSKKIIGCTNLIIKKRFLISAIVFNVIYLGIFKYSDFLISNFNFITNSNINPLNLPFPLALSFVTFQTIAFICDSYEGNIKDLNLRKYSLFIIFFPQLVAGPIVRYNDMIHQFESEINSKVNYNNIIIGLIVLSIGIIKKVFIADNLSIFADQVFGSSENISFLESWLGTLSFTFQIYFDFSGYIDMATGIALLFNINLPLNFNSPYKATGIIDFWQRWHITLTRFLTTYIFTPLLRSFKKLNFMKSMLATLIVFLIAGLWHGPSWLFITFGAMHGLGLIINHIYRRFSPFKLNRLVSQIITFVYINFSFVIFRSESTDDAQNIIIKMLGVDFFKGLSLPNIDLNYGSLVSLGFSIIICFYLKNTNWLVQKLKLSKIMD